MNSPQAIATPLHPARRRRRTTAAAGLSGPTRLPNVLLVERDRKEPSDRGTQFVHGDDVFSSYGVKPGPKLPHVDLRDERYAVHSNGSRIDCFSRALSAGWLSSRFLNTHLD